MSEPLSTPEDVVAFETGRQKVQKVNGAPRCDWHADRSREQSGLADQIGRQTGLIDETQPHTHTESAPYRGQCVDCARAQPNQYKQTPWEDAPRPNQMRRTTPEKSDRMPYNTSWPNQPRRTSPFTPLPYSTSGRVAVRHDQGDLDADVRGVRRLAYRVSTELPDVIGLRKLAHDSGDGQTIFHCPFCGSGQVIATSDGGVECEFCHASFTVQVQPQYPAFPQTMDGAPVNVPGMGPDFSPYGGTPPGQEAPVPMDGEEGGDEESDDDNPFGGNAAETDPPEEDDDEDEDSGGGGNPFTKKSYVTTTGAVLDYEAYLKHLALHHSRNTGETLRRVRASNGVR